LVILESETPDARTVGDMKIIIKMYTTPLWIRSEIMLSRLDGIPSSSAFWWILTSGISQLDR